MEKAINQERPVFNLSRKWIKIMLCQVVQEALHIQADHFRLKHRIIPSLYAEYIQLPFPESFHLLINTTYVKVHHSANTGKKKKRKHSRALVVSWVENIQKACAGSTTWLLSMVLPIVEQMVWGYSRLFLILDHNKLSFSESVTGRKQQNTKLLCLCVNVACMCYCALKNTLCVYLFSVLLTYVHMH